MKKFLAIFTALVFSVCCFGACKLDKSTASVSGYGGELKLAAKLNEDGAAQIEILKHSETYGLGDFALEAMVARINDKQSLLVDTVSGATVTSLATLDCAEKAISLLDTDLEKFFKEPRPAVADPVALTCDVAVIGAGGAGLTAAITAAELGADVVVIEKLSIPGGTSSLSGGKIMAVGSELQNELYEQDSIASFAAYLYDFSDKNTGTFRQVELAANSADNIRFLEDSGAVFSEQLEGTGEDKKPRRIHTAVNDDVPGGGAMVRPLFEKAVSLGVTFIYDTTATELVLETDGSVRGLLGRNKDGGKCTVNCGSVIIATGGFDKNQVLLYPYGLKSGISMSCVGSTGDGVTLAKDAGAKTFETASFMATLEDVATGLFETSGLVVNPNGARFANEADDPFLVASALINSGFCEAYLIADANAYIAALRKGLDPDMVITADTIADLGEKIGAENLDATVKNYNAACKNKDDIYFNKPPQYLKTVSRGPFYAVPLSLRTYGTIGGVVTNNLCQVVDKNNVALRGLYAAGEVANGAYFITGFPGFGSSLAVAVEMGRTAGKYAAKHAMENKK